MQLAAAALVALQGEATAGRVRRRLCAVQLVKHNYMLLGRCLEVGLCSAPAGFVPASCGRAATPLNLSAALPALWSNAAVPVAP